MRRLAVAALLIIVGVVGIVRLADAASGQFAWIEMWRDIQYPVEQQTPDWMLYDPVTNLWYRNPDHTNWVENPTQAVDDVGECVWDVDDQLRFWADPNNDRLAAHTSASKTICQFDDFLGRLWLVDILASTPNLTVTLEMDAIGETFTIHPFKMSGNKWRYTGCVAGPQTTTSSVEYLPEVAGSNGGHAIYDEGTLTIANNTDKVVRDLFVDFWVGRQVQWSQACVAGPNEVIYTDQYGEWIYYEGQS